MGVTASSSRPSASIGYVVLPDDTDRASYVQACRLTGRVSVVTTEGEYIHWVPVAKAAWLDLRFPAALGERGSCVVLVGIPPANRPVLTSVLHSADEPGGALAEHAFELVRTEGGAHVGVSGRGDTADLSLMAIGAKAGEGSLRLAVSNPQQDARFELHAGGDAEILASGALQLEAGALLELRVDDHSGTEPQALITYAPADGLTYRDHHGNVLQAGAEYFRFQAKGGKVIESAKTINLGTEGGAKEAGVLGDTLEGILNDLITEILAITLNSNLGPTYPVPINAAKFQAIATRIKGIKSRVVTLD